MDFGDAFGGRSDDEFWDALTYGADDVRGFVADGGDDEPCGCMWGGGAEDSNSLPTLLILGGLDWDDADGGDIDVGDDDDGVDGAADIGMSGFISDEADEEELAEDIGKAASVNVLAATAIGLGEDGFDGGADDEFAGEDGSGFGGADDGLGAFVENVDQFEKIADVAKDPMEAAWNGFVDGAFKNIWGGDAVTAAVPGAESDLLTTMVGGDSGDGESAPDDSAEGGDSLSSFVEADGGGMLKWTQVQNALRTLPPSGKQHFGPPMKTKPGAPAAPRTVKR